MPRRFFQEKTERQSRTAILATRVSLRTDFFIEKFYHGTINLRPSEEKE
jgi:hypothetical protein